MIDQAGVSSFPLNNAYGAAVLGADTSAVRCVIVNGVIRKWGHSLVDVDLAEARSPIETSRDYLLSEVGYHRTCSSTTRRSTSGRQDSGHDLPMPRRVPPSMGRLRVAVDAGERQVTSSRCGHRTGDHGRAFGGWFN